MSEIKGPHSNIPQNRQGLHLREIGSIISASARRSWQILIKAVREEYYGASYKLGPDGEPLRNPDGTRVSKRRPASNKVYWN